ncbi:MAG TPA: sigma-70 family RNA polymerase sigma factor [Ignavibacteriales bacterium]|nr:sigma-70 family RNA polymerase sigma factor [Ignavibacteriales bacterium]
MDNTDINIMKYSDEDLMALVTERNTKALKVLYDRYGKSVYNFILRYTNHREMAEDLLQETFTKAWFASHSFDPDKGAFKSWLFTIGINLTRNEMVKKRYSYPHIDLEEVILDDESTAKAGEEPAGCFLEYTELKDTITSALEQLSPLLKEVIILKHYQKMKFSEIAEITNTPEGTLKARFHNALGQLKRILQKTEY